MSRKYNGPSQIETLQLFEALEGGSKVAFADLVYKFSFIPQRVARRYRWATNHHDLLNIGYEALMKSIRKFNPALCNNFVMWAYPQVKTAIGRAKHAEKRWVDRDHIDDYRDKLLGDQDLEATYISDQLKEMLTLYLHRLERTPKLVMIKTYGLYQNEPQTLREVSEELGLPTTRIWKAKQTAIKQLRKMFQVHANNPISDYGIEQRI